MVTSRQLLMLGIGLVVSNFVWLLLSPTATAERAFERSFFQSWALGMVYLLMRLH